MSQVMNVKDVLSITCPNRSTRYAVVQTPKSGGTYTGVVAIPESEFQTTMANRAYSLAKAPSSMGARNDIVRGVMTKQETYATLEMVSPNEAMEKDMQSLKTPKFTEFLLQSVNEVTEERYQLIETFGDTVGFFFGTRPKVYQYSGVLMNTADYAWRDEWKKKYEEEFRGTRCVEDKKRAYLTYDYVLREGYILGMSIGQIAANPNSVDFSFTMFITRELNLQPTEALQLLEEIRVERAKERTIRNKWLGSELPPELFSETYRELGTEATDEVVRNSLEMQHQRKIEEHLEMEAFLAQKQAESVKEAEEEQAALDRRAVREANPISEIDAPIWAISKTPCGANIVSGGAAGSRDNPDPNEEAVRKVLSYNSERGILTPLGL